MAFEDTLVVNSGTALERKEWLNPWIHSMPSLGFSRSICKMMRVIINIPVSFGHRPTSCQFALKLVGLPIHRLAFGSKSTR